MEPRLNGREATHIDKVPSDYEQNLNLKKAMNSLRSYADAFIASTACFRSQPYRITRFFAQQIP
jgi:hypothetical protein